MSKEAKAAHAAVKTPQGGDHVVSIGNLRVMICQDSERDWYAQGLEIDYLAQGDTLDEVQEAFCDGLAWTVEEHLKSYGDITRLLRPAPQDVWAEFFAKAEKGTIKLSQISVHSLTQPTENKFYNMVAKSKPLNLLFERLDYYAPAVRE